MDEHEFLAGQFEKNRPRLRAVAYRMLGSLSDAEDAVQQAWLRLSRADTGGVENLEAWLTTVVARICLDMLRARESRREEPLESIADRNAEINAEQEALLADSVGLALLMILNTLAPAGRLAFVLHDMFGMSFDEIAPIVERTPKAARQLASRARRRVQGKTEVRDADIPRQREVVDAFLAAARAGDFEGLLALLDPDIVLRTDRAEIRGAAAVAKNASLGGARAAQGGARVAQPSLVDGAVGVIVAPRGRLQLVIRFNIKRGKITEIEVIADPERVAGLDLAMLGS
jgi:RNA polymerase sigma factor (sigma-70 family)